MFRTCKHAKYLGQADNPVSGDKIRTRLAKYFKLFQTEIWQGAEVIKFS